MDNRVLNNMRYRMNQQIKDEHGIMQVNDFRRMFFTAFGRIEESKKIIIYNLLLPIIKVKK